MQYLIIKIGREGLARSGETNKRLITAFITVPILIFSIFSDKLDLGITLLVYVILVGFFANMEILNFGKIKKIRTYPVVNLIVILLLNTSVFLTKFIDFNYFSAALSIILFGMFVIFFIQIFSNNLEKVLETVSLNVFSFVYPGFLLLFMLLVKQEFGPWYVMMLLGISLGGDAGAYFIGRFFGRKKLKIKSSPKKTLEGYIGGLVVSLIISLVFSKLAAPQAFKGIIFEVLPIELLFITILSISSFMGDLLESSLKRDTGKKDSHQLLKMAGHGGLLDIIDSVIFVFPIGYCILKFLEIFS